MLEILLLGTMDCLQDWPEPIVRVQSLSDSCTPIIPARYIKPPPDRPSSAAAPSGSEGQNIPVIDLCSLQDCHAAAGPVAAACGDWGFFQVVNHGVPLELMRRCREVWREFFHLPMEEKQKFANSPRTYEGYGSRLGVEKGAILDWGDYYFLHLLPSRLKDHRKWPPLPPPLRETVEEYGREVVRMCGAVMRMLSVGLGLGEERLQGAFGGEEFGACMRVNYYPKCPQPDLTLGLSSHSDPGGITVLLPDDRVRGLQVRRGAAAWVTVDLLPDAFIINVGDQIQVLSNATYKSVEHRVVVNSDADRLSLAFFYNPKSDLPVGPLPEMVSLDRPPLYSPMTFDEYRLYIRKRGPRGKSQVESLKTV